MRSGWGQTALWTTALVAVLLACSGQAAAKAPVAPVAKSDVSTRWAILVGVDDYLSARKLEYCGADMRSLRDQLIACGFAADHVFLLHDKAEQTKDRPMKANIENHLKTVLGLAGDNDVVVVAFSGHGVQLKGKSYFCPAEARVSDPATLIAMDTVYDQLLKCAAPFRLLVIDACRNDPVPDGQRDMASPPDTAGFMQSLERPPEGILALTSCAPGEIAREEKDFGHGVFMHYFLEGAAGAADANHNGLVSMAELYAYVNDKTKSYVARKFVDSQRPTLKGEIHDDFPLFAVSSRVSEGTDSGGMPRRPAGPAITNSLGMKFALIPAGEFKMGSPRKEIDRLLAQAQSLEMEPEYLDLIRSEWPQHSVKITKPFYLGVHEVTVGQFRRFIDDSHYATEAETDGRGGFGFDATTDDFAKKPQFTWKKPGFPQEDDHPVVLVSWNDAAQFCRWLSDKEGRIYRLPTEAEWEYACRAGTLTRYWSGDEPEKLAEIANTADAKAKARFPGWELTIAGNDGFVFTAPVGFYKPNSFGLFDMHGNVSEWCADWFSKRYYAESAAEDPPGPNSTGQRTLRGGSWNSRPQFARSADRGGCDPSDRSCVTGFRVVLVP